MFTYICLPLDIWYSIINRHINFLSFDNVRLLDVQFLLNISSFNIVFLFQYSRSKIASSKKKTFPIFNPYPASCARIQNFLRGRGFQQIILFIEGVGRWGPEAFYFGNFTMWKLINLNFLGVSEPPLDPLIRIIFLSLVSADGETCILNFEECSGFFVGRGVVLCVCLSVAFL